MAELEVKATENVMEACAFTPSIRKVVLTSSLLACIWQDTSRCNQSTVINQDSWSDESICLDKKVYFFFCQNARFENGKIILVDVALPGSANRALYLPFELLKCNIV